MNDAGTLTLPSGRTVVAPSRKAIPPATPFSLKVRAFDQRALELVLGTLWLVILLSGFGARIRRGFGSLALAPTDTETAQALQDLDLSFAYAGADLKGIAGSLAAGLSRVKAVFQHDAAIGSPSPASTYRVLSAQTARLSLIQPKGRLWGSWQDAMDDLREDVYRAFKGAIKRSSIGSASPRHPSPLIIQIKRTGAGGYFGVLLAFKEDLYFGPGWGTLDSFLRGLTGYEVEAVTLP
jgi:CRISPR-associated protein Cmr1